MPGKSSSKSVLLSSLVIVLAIAAFLVFNKNMGAPADGALTKIQATTLSLPSSYKIQSVPFTTQAPYGVWDKLHNEACEKASVLMAYAWIKSINISQDFAEQEIQKLSAWSMNQFNSWDLSAKETAEMASVNYGLKSKLLNNPSLDNIKKELLQNHIVVMGMAGMKLQNPYFKSPGPIYHMLVITGYDKTGFIVNDPGTKNGKNFHYSYQNIKDSAHDWNGSATTLLQSQPVAIIFSK
jgi:hypothetical protein